MSIDWSFSSPQLFLNPRMPHEQHALLNKAVYSLKDYNDHIWVATSGSTSLASEKIKLAALSKKALLTSAKAVNDHLQSNSQDRWVNPLPDFHVGGIGIWARSFLSGAETLTFKEKWDPVLFCQFLITSQGTLTSLVPAQVYDLVSHKLKAPPLLRALIVGGGSLAPSLYREAKQLGWNLLPSYGMTECCSQVATAGNEKEGNALKILPHVEIKISEKGLICIKSPSLLTTYLIVTQKNTELVDPKKENWLMTQDQGVVEGNYLTVFGREGDFIKIGGESVQMPRLENILEDIKCRIGIESDLALFAFPDERLGHVVHLVTDEPSNPSLHKLIDRYHQQVLPFERIRQIHILKTIPRSPLRKLLKQELFFQLGLLPN